MGTLGGPQSFPGYSPGEVRAGRYWSVQGNLLWRVADILPILNQALFAGLGVEGGHVYERVDPVADGELYGISASLGGRTPLGTVTLGVGKATGSWSAWLTLGTPVCSERRWKHIGSRSKQSQSLNFPTQTRSHA